MTRRVVGRVTTVVDGAGVLSGENDESSAVTVVVDTVTVVTGGLEDGRLPDGRRPGGLFTTSGLRFVLGRTRRLRVTGTEGTNESVVEVTGVTLGAFVVLVKGVVGLKYVLREIGGLFELIGISFGDVRRADSMIHGLLSSKLVISGKRRRLPFQ